MKRMICLLLLLCLLCGCGSRTGSEQVPTGPEILTDTVPTTQMHTEEALIDLQPQQEAPVPTVAPAPGFPDGVLYSVVEHDNSIRNAEGEVLVNIRYQRVILDSTQNPLWENVNEYILEDYRSFQENVAYVKETSAEEWEEMLQSTGILYGNLMANCSARVVNNSGGLFSIRMQREWFMGGVFNVDYHGLNFDLNTGEVLPLSRLSDLAEAEFEAQLKRIICAELQEDIDFLFQDPAEVLAEYTLSDFDFYIEEGELVLTFPTYTFGPGAMGPAVIPTGLYPQL